MFANIDVKSLRKYGKAPYSIVVIHGGPGIPGEMAPVARELSLAHGILEPIQTKATLRGQLEELRTTLKDNSNLPVTLIGYSWGAMLSFIFTARDPAFVQKLILVSSGVLEDKYAVNIAKTRLSRLSVKEKTKIDSLQKNLNDPTNVCKNTTFAKLGELISKTDSYNPLPYKNEVIKYQYDVYESVWKDAKALRSSGGLLEMGKKIDCPVVAIHGDYDPHPSEGVQEPLSSILKDFQFIPLKNCGHLPWIEREARGEFYRILKKELS